MTVLPTHSYYAMKEQGQDVKKEVDEGEFMLGVTR